MVKTKDLLPPNLQGDKNLEGLCEAADKVFAIEDKLDKLLVYLIDEVSADVLPFLAWQFHVEGWELAGTESKKRTLIKNSIELHRYKGTPWAIENALKSISIDGKISEWFEYSGDPYKFKVKVDVKDIGIDLDVISRIEDLINEYKNKRSWLETLVLYIKSHGVTPRFGCACLSGESITVYPYQQGLIEATGSVPGFIAGFAPGVEEVTIYPQ